MRIAYILDENISMWTGVTQKIAAKIKIWESFGHDVMVFSLRSETYSSILPRYKIISIREKSSLIRKFFQHLSNLKKLRDELKKFAPDIVYTRYIKYSFGLIRTLKSQGIYVVEINTNDISEFILVNKIIGYYNKYTRHFLFSGSSGIVAVTNELAQHHDFTKYHKPIRTISNGMLADSFGAIREENTDKYTLAFIGTPNQAWHGIEKIFYLADRIPEFNFVIIGPGYNMLKSTFPDINCLKNLMIHGYLDRDQASQVLKKCDVGISTLSLYVKNMKEASPLKTRDYLMMGLPVIIGYYDTDLSDKELSFVLNVGCRPDNIKNNINSIRSFTLDSRKINPEIIRDFARRTFDMRNKECERLQFLEQLCRDDLV